MKESSFKYSDPFLTRIHFEAKEGQEVVSMTNCFTVNVYREEHSTKATVTLGLVVGEEENAPFLLEAEVAADFSWGEEDFDEEQTETLLTKNAPALLLSYLRPIVASVTNVSPFPVYNLPFVDLREEE